MNNKGSGHDYTKKLFGKKRYFKEISREEFHFLFENAPVELFDLTNVYDVDSFEYFMLIRFSNISERLIKRIKVRIFLYLDSPLPYKKINYTYEFTKKNNKTRILGGDFYIDLPETYYKKYDIFIDEIEYFDGECEALSLSTLKTPKERTVENIRDIDAIVTSYDKSEKFPAIIMPSFSDSSWICTCGQKNLSQDDSCIRCRRTKESLLEMVKKYETGDYQKDQYSMLQRARKADHTLNRIPKEDDPDKQRLIEEQKIKVEKREKYKEKMILQALPRIALAILAVFVFYFLLQWLDVIR